MPPRSHAVAVALMLLPAAACGRARVAARPLEIEAFAVRDTVWPGDSLLVGWTIRNPGARRTFRDYAAFYRLTVVGPDGRGVTPEYDRRGHAVLGEKARELATGAEVRHLVDLGCVTEPLVPRTNAPTRCALRYRVPAPGAYRVIVQHVPVPPPGEPATPESWPSAADTLTLHVAGSEPGAS